ncbi:MAG: hypothetical protein ACLS8R_07640, partial [Anaeromassilibacillus sp.]
MRPAPQQNGNQPAQTRAPQQGGAQGQQGNAPRRPAVKPGKITPVRPAPQQNGGQQPHKKPGAPIPPPRPMQTGAPNTTNVKRGEGRLVDTRASHVELDKY